MKVYYNYIIIYKYILVFIGYKSEWFWRHWKDNVTDVVKFMEENYPPNFTYQDFGSELKMEFFNASEVADIVQASGARYVIEYIVLDEDVCLSLYKLNTLFLSY